MFRRMTVPSPRLRTAWRVGSALAAAAGSAVVTSALVNRSRNRSQRKQDPAPEDAAPEPTELTVPAVPLDAPPAPGEVAVPPDRPDPPHGAATVPPGESPAPPAAELLVHDPAPAAGRATPARAPSDALARAIEAADRVEAAPAAWSRTASELRTQAAGETGWTPPATAVPSLGDIRVPTGPPTPAVGTAAALVADAEAHALDAPPTGDGGRPGTDTRAPRLPGHEARRPPRRRHRTGPDDLAAAAGGAATVTRPPPPPAAPLLPPAGPGEPSGPSGPSGDVTPDRRLLLFIGVAVAVALVLGLGVVVLGSGGDDGPEAADTTPTTDGGARGTGGTTGSQPATTPVAQLTPTQAFAQAGQRLQTAGTFAYEGTSSATDVSPVRPGPWMGVDLTVEGRVQLAPPRLLERGTASDGTVGETVSDGVTIWGRSAAGAGALDGQDLQTLYTLPDPTPAKVGGLLLPQWLTSVTGATDGGQDSLGRRTFRATLPASVLGTIEDDRDAVDAVVVLALDQQGDPAHIEVTTSAGPPLRLVYDIVRIGDAVQIPIPGEPAGAGAGTTGQTTRSTTTSSTL
jgi:hypothetical protein